MKSRFDLMKRLYTRATSLWLQGYKLSAAVAGTGSVPNGRKEGAYGETQHVPLCERRKRDDRSLLPEVERKRRLD